MTSGDKHQASRGRLLEPVEIAFMILGVAAISALIAVGGSWQDALSNLLAALVGVFFGLRLERMQSARRDAADASHALRMLKAELGVNLLAAQTIADERLDLEAVVNALLRLREEYWLAVTRGGRVELFRDLELLGKVSLAYDAVRNLRVLADLYFKGGELVRSPKSAGFTTRFDPLRKEEAEKAVRQIQSALDEIDSGLESAG